MEVIDLQKQKIDKEMNRYGNWTIHFGKYKNNTFSDLLEDRDYCIWLMNQTEFISKNEKLKKYLEYNLTKPNE